MNPRRLDVAALGGRLRAMRRLLDELERLGPVDAARFAQDYSAQLIVERIVSQLVDLAAAVNAHAAAAVTGSAPGDVRTSFAAASTAGVIDGSLADALAPSAGLRNVLVHAYIDLDVSRLVAAVPLAREQYGEYVRQVARWLTERDGEARADRPGT